MRLNLVLTAFAVAGVLGTATVSRAAQDFVVEKVDSTGTPLQTGVMFFTPSGDIVATDAPYFANPAYFLGGPPPNDPVRILRRRAGVWELHAPPPPQDSTMSHDLACDADGKLFFLTFQGAGTDECRPILEEETAGGWQTTPLDTGQVEAQALAIDSQGQPWVAMLRRMKSGSTYTRSIVVARRTDQGWARDSIDIVAGNNAYGGDRLPFALDPSDRPQLLLLGPGGIGLLRAVRTAEGWQVDAIDAQAIPSSVHPALVIAPDGTPHVLYGQGPVLWYAKLTPTGWSRETLPVPVYGPTCALALDHVGRPHAVFCTPCPEPFDPECIADAVAYGYRDDLGWNVSRVYNDSTANTRLQIALDADDRPYLYLHDPRYRYPVLLTTGTNVAAVAPAGDRRNDLFTMLSRNPSRSTDIASWSVTLPARASVSLGVFDVAGRCLGSSAPQTLPAGRNTLRWNPPIPGPGCYFVSASIAGRRTPAVQWILME